MRQNLIFNVVTGILAGFLMVARVSAQDEFGVQEVINTVNTLAQDRDLTENQRRLAVALAKANYYLIGSQGGLEFDDGGNLINGTPQQRALDRTLTKILKILLPPDWPEREGFLEELSADELRHFDKKLKQLLNQLSPGLYTTLPTILFNSANMQNTQIQQRLWTMRMRKGQPGLHPGSSMQSGADGKMAILDGKNVALRDVDTAQKWVVFVDGNGMWSQAKTVNNLPSYNTYAGGVQIGASRELFDGLVVGPYVGYQGTKVDFTGQYGGGSSATHNSVRFGLFAEYQIGGWYNNLIVGGAYNSIEVNHGIDISGYGNELRTMAKGNVEGGEFDLLYGTGYEFKAGNLTFGPSTGFQYTHVALGGTQEKGAGVLNQKIGSQSVSSLLYTLGGQAYYDIKLSESVLLQPLVSLAWQHEFLQDGYGLKASILNQSYTYKTTNPGRDQFIGGVGFNLVLGSNFSAYAICNLINSDAKVFSQAVSGGINVSF